jgi:gluconolactonase
MLACRLFPLVAVSCSWLACGSDSAPARSGDDGGTSGVGGAAGDSAGSGGTVQASGGSNSGAPDAAAGSAGTSAGAGGSSQPVVDAAMSPPVCAMGATYGAPLSAMTMPATLVKSGFNFLEGPVWFANLGALFFSDMNMGGGGTSGPPSVIHKLTPPSTVEDFILMSGSNGLAIAPDGQILAATHDTRSLTKFDPVTKTRMNLALTYMGKHFNSPNDLTVRSDGNIYFTDPNYQLAGRTNETMITGVYRVSPGGDVSLVDDKQQQPNGITLSVDQNTLYVSTAQSVINKYAVNADGSVGAPVKFVNASSDGMAIDCAGNLYTTNANQGSVDVYSPAGTKIGSVTGVGSCTNVAFGGGDKKTLYVTSGSGQGASLYSAQLAVPGFPY